MAFYVQKRLRYLALKGRDLLSIKFGSNDGGQISTKYVSSQLWKDNSEKHMTMVRCIEGDKMEPTFSVQGEKLLVSKIRSLFIGDVVLLKDPSDSNVERASQIAMVEGDEMVSINENDEPFELENAVCWVLCDEDSIKEELDSWSFWPLSMQNILGRALYAMQSSSYHGRLRSSAEAMDADSPVLAV